MKRRSLLAGLVVLVVALAGLSAYYLSETQRPGPLTTGSKSVSEYGLKGTAYSINGLQLTLTLNSTSLARGEALAVDLYEFNPANVKVNVTAGNLWATRILGVGIPPCNFQNEPISAAVARGNYGPENFSQALPLQLVSATENHGCAPLWTPSSWVFSPRSNITQLVGCLGTVCPAQGLLFSNEQQVVVSGTYGQFGLSAFAPLAPGTYTVLAGDEWGALVLLHFQVVS